MTYRRRSLDRNSWSQEQRNWRLYRRRRTSNLSGSESAAWRYCRCGRKYLHRGLIQQCRTHGEYGGRHAPRSLANILEAIPLRRLPLPETWSPATAATLNTPEDVEIDGNGNLFIADQGNARVRVVYAGGAQVAALIAATNGGTVAVAGRYLHRHGRRYGNAITPGSVVLATSVAVAGCSQDCFGRSWKHLPCRQQQQRHLV